MKKKILLGLAAGAAAAVGILFALGVFSSADQFLLPEGASGAGIVWTPDGKGLLIFYRGDSGDRIELRLLPRWRVRWRVEDLDLPDIPFEFQNRFAAFSPQGDLVAVGETNAIRILDLGTGEELSRWPLDGEAFYLCTTASGDFVGLVYKEETLYLERRSWEGELLSREEIPHVRDSHAALSPNGRFLAYAGSAYEIGGTSVVNLWDLETGTERSWNLEDSLPGLREWGTVTGVAPRPDGGEIAIALGLYEVGHPFLLSLDTGSGSLTELPPPNVPLDISGERIWFSPLAYSPDGMRLAVSPGLRMVCVVDSGETRVLWEDGAVALTFSPDGQYLAFAAGRKIVVLPVADGKRG
jgi:WD40 repeat protein